MELENLDQKYVLQKRYPLPSIGINFSPKYVNS